jgi:hypothetical protein
VFALLTHYSAPVMFDFTPLYSNFVPRLRYRTPP